MTEIELFGELFINLEALPKIRFEDSNLANQVMFDLLKNQNSCKVKFKIEPFKESKSNPQLRYYKGVLIKYITLWINDKGHSYSEWDIDLLMRDKFCFNIVEEIKIPKDLAKISKDEMRDFITQILEWCDSMDINIPTQQI